MKENLTPLIVLAPLYTTFALQIIACKLLLQAIRVRMVDQELPYSLDDVAIESLQ
jgi:threonine/homoserine efflux transporter RhtA